MGVQIQPVDEATAKALGRSETTGALISEVFANEPADKAGIKAGDIIIRINAKDIKDTSELLRTVAQIAPGEKINVTVWSNGKEKVVSLVLGERGNANVNLDKPGTPGRDGKILPGGLQLRSITKDEAQALGLSKAEGLLKPAAGDPPPGSSH